MVIPAEWLAECTDCWLQRRCKATDYERVRNMKTRGKNNNARLSALALALGLSLPAAVPAQAQEIASTSTEWTKEKSGVMAGTSIAGAVLGGPVGFVLGIAAGDWLGNSVNKAATTENLATERDEALAALANAQEQLVLAQVEAARYHDLALDSLQLDVMFSTANDSVTPRARARLDALARLLKDKPQVDIKLAGFADPRGADVYNLELSERRAQSVEKYLISQGVNPAQIQSAGYGARNSEAPRNDLDAYAMERVVTIELQERNAGLAISQ